jgi:type IV pilus assembly protein PilB
LPKSLAEIAIDAGLVNKAQVTKAARLAEEQKQPLVAILVRELGVDEVALIGALRKQIRVPLIDPKDVQVDPEALRLVGRDLCARLRVLPVAIVTDGDRKVLRVAMADPTDTAAVLELEQAVHADIEVSALPLSAIEELVDKGYKQISTAVVSRPRSFGDNLFVTAKTPRAATQNDGGESEVSVTAQIPLSQLQAQGSAPADETDRRFVALCQLLVSKGVITEAELVDAMRGLEAKKPGSDS